MPEPGGAPLPLLPRASVPVLDVAPHAHTDPPTHLLSISCIHCMVPGDLNLLIWFSLDGHQFVLELLLIHLSVQFSRLVVSDSLRPHGLQHARPPCPSPTPRVKLMSVESVMPSNHLILCPLLLLLPSIFPSIRVFADESVLCIRWPNYWSFSFSIRPSSEYSGLISFRMDWLDLLAVQGTLESLLQHHS